MTLHVCFQTVALSEGFITQRTLVRSLSVVRPHVNSQVRFTSARFPANPAHKRLEARVDGHVVVQINLGQKEIIKDIFRHFINEKIEKTICRSTDNH